MDTYYPHLDILQYEIDQDALWVYASILLCSYNSDGTLSGQYALEIDNDVDGRGDWLVIVSAPSSTVWSTSSVLVWQDANRDVGGSESIKAGKSSGFCDGYETMVFDKGSGADADAAWALISPNDPSIVQLAIKGALVDTADGFLAGVWAGTVLDPALFDFNDKMTQEEAGAAVKSFSYYPIQKLAELDRACRVTISIVAQGEGFGSCQTYTPVQDGDPILQPGGPGNPGCPLTLEKCPAQGYCSFDSDKCICGVCG